jgi:uncharacterized damage-inducible protein DinB
MIPKPDASEFLAYYGKYIDQVQGDDALQALQTQLPETLTLVRGLAEGQGGHRYAPGKWSIRQVLAHVIDAERIFAYRALRISRGDPTPLASFDENAYAENAGADARTLADLADELEHLRLANVALLRALDDETLARRGTASDAEVSVRALAWIIAGHELHHRTLLRERYLADAPAAAAV